MVGQGSDHLVYTFVPIPPFIALTIASILQRILPVLGISGL